MDKKEKKPKDYKKLSTIKSVLFLVLAAAVLFGMYLKEKPEDVSKNRPAEAQLSAVSTKASGEAVTDTGTAETGEKTEVEEGESYTDKEHVALYLHTYGKLPSNFITKTKAKKEGWDPEKGNLQEVLPGMSIGGGGFQNEEKRLPEKEGRTYKECDIDYRGGPRGEKRIVYSNDGLIYYTGDHYQTFELLYGEEE